MPDEYIAQDLDAPPFVPGSPAHTVALAGALAAGQAAGALRKSGLYLPHASPPGMRGNPEDFGAFQWAEAAGYGHPSLRSVFTHGFLSIMGKES
jgi:hypothetical protein